MAYWAIVSSEISPRRPRPAPNARNNLEQRMLFGTEAWIDGTGKTTSTLVIPNFYDSIL